MCCRRSIHHERCPYPAMKFPRMNPLPGKPSLRNLPVGYFPNSSLNSCCDFDFFKNRSIIFRSSAYEAIPAFNVSVSISFTATGQRPLTGRTRPKNQENEQDGAWNTAGASCVISSVKGAVSMTLCVLRMFVDRCPSCLHALSAQFSGFLFQNRERGFRVVIQHGARCTPTLQRSESVIEPLALSLRDDLSFRFWRI